MSEESKTDLDMDRKTKKMVKHYENPINPIT